MKTKQKRITLLGFLLLTLLLCSCFSQTKRTAPDEEPKGPAACLSCHGGSFDKLAAKTPGFKTESGLIVNPHQYIPHNKKEIENVPNCLDCHTAHSNPPKEKIDLSRVEVESCYASCHHMRNFEKCSKCHPNRKMR